MKRLILIISAIVVLLSLNICSAKVISQPVQIGKVSFAEDREPLDGFIFEGTNSNIWQEKSKFVPNAYKKGIASWGNIHNKIYIHYSYTDNKYGHYIVTLYGDEATDNTIKVWTYRNKIFSLDTDKNINLFLIDSDIAQPCDKNYTLIGKRQDGKFVKYFDVRTLLDQYCGVTKMTLDEYNKNPERGVSYFLKNIEIKNDTFVFPYYKYYWTNKNNHILVGEIRCKWDENAQWFSVDNVVY